MKTRSYYESVRWRARGAPPGIGRCGCTVRRVGRAYQLKIGLRAPARSENAEKEPPSMRVVSRRPHVELTRRPALSVQSRFAGRPHGKRRAEKTPACMRVVRQRRESGRPKHWFSFFTPDPRIVSCYPTDAPESFTIFSTTDASHPRRPARRATSDAGTPSPRMMSAFRLAIAAEGFASSAGR